MLFKGSGDSDGLGRGGCERAVEELLGRVSEIVAAWCTAEQEQQQEECKWYCEPLPAMTQCRPQS